MKNYTKLVKKLKRDCEHVGLKLELKEVDGANALTIGIKMRSNYGQSTIYGDGFRLNGDNTFTFFDALGELGTWNIDECKSSTTLSLSGLNTLKSAYFYLFGFYEGVSLGKEIGRSEIAGLLELAPKIAELE